VRNKNKCATYDATVDQWSWAAMKAFLDEILI
jgi:hypothetical protein